ALAGPAKRLAKIEMLELGRHLARPLRPAPLPCLLEARSEMGVHLSLLLIPQHVVGLLHFLEPLLSRLVVRVQVRVMFLRKLAISLLNLVRASTTFNPQDFVVVFTHGCDCRMGARSGARGGTGD